MESQQVNCYVAVTITLAAATLALGLRLWARRLKGISLWTEDYLIILAFAAAIVYDAVEYAWLRIGLGLHIQDATIPNSAAIYYCELFQWIMEHAYTISIAASQLSLLALYVRAFGSVRSAKFMVVGLVFCVVAWFIARFFVVTFQCDPPQAKWEEPNRRDCPVETAKFFIGSVAGHLAIDIFLMLLPAFLISTLSRPWLQKLSIVAMFMFGIVVCVCSAIMLVTASQYDDASRDLTWGQVGPANWSAVEINLSIITACLPLLRPVFLRIKEGFGARMPLHIPDGIRFHTRRSIRLARMRTNKHIAQRYDIEGGDVMYGQGQGQSTTCGPGTRHASEQSRNIQDMIMVRNELKLQVSDIGK